MHGLLPIVLFGPKHITHPFTKIRSWCVVFFSMPHIGLSIPMSQEGDCVSFLSNGESCSTAEHLARRCGQEVNLLFDRLSGMSLRARFWVVQDGIVGQFSEGEECNYNSIVSTIKAAMSTAFEGVDFCEVPEREVLIPQRVGGTLETALLQ